MPSLAVWWVRLKVIGVIFTLFHSIALNYKIYLLCQYVVQNSWTNDIKAESGFYLTNDSLMLSHIKEGRKGSGIEVSFSKQEEIFEGKLKSEWRRHKAKFQWESRQDSRQEA